MINLDTNKTIADILYQKGYLTSDQLSAIKFEHQNTNKSIEDIVVSRGYVTNEQFAQSYGELYGFEFKLLKDNEADAKLIDLVTLEICKKNRLVPFKLENNSLSVVMADPTDLPTIDFIERKTGYKVIPYITSNKNIEHILESQKGTELTQEISEALKTLSANTLKIEETSQELSDATLRDAPIARIVSMILETAVKTNASDVHLEPGETKTRLRYRVDGILEEKRTLPKQMHDSVVARIKILAGMKIDEKRVPLDGQFKVVVGDTETDLRVSTLPTIFGEKVVIRLLQEEGTTYSFRDLGMRGYTLRRYEETILKPNGMILATGPTSSGKTVTLASTLSKLNSARVNIITLEDPVEIKIPGVNQVQVNTGAGLTFATGLRSFLRQDPNIIFVGEIRDGETAELAVHAALTGHMVLSTIHTNSAAGAIPRLLDMGVEAFLLVSIINGSLAQRLVRRICPHCISQYDPPKELLQEINDVLVDIQNNENLMSKDSEISKLVTSFIDKPDLKLYRGNGCEKCSNTGYKGRIGIFELLTNNDQISKAVLEGEPVSTINRLSIESGMLTLVQDGVLRALEGTTTLEEVMRVARQ